MLCFRREQSPPDATKRSQERVVSELWSRLEQCLLESLKGQGDEKPGTLQLAALKQHCTGKDSDNIKIMVVMSADDL